MKITFFCFPREKGKWLEIATSILVYPSYVECLLISPCWPSRREEISVCPTLCSPLTRESQEKCEIFFLKSFLNMIFHNQADEDEHSLLIRDGGRDYRTLQLWGWLSTSPASRTEYKHHCLNSVCAQVGWCKRIWGPPHSTLCSALCRVWPKCVVCPDSIITCELCLSLA